MPVLHNAAGAAVPVREAREATGLLTGLNTEVVLPLNGDENALVYVASSAFIGTLEFTGLGDNSAGYLPIVAYPYSPGCSGGPIPLAGQPLLVDALVAANTTRVYSVPVGQLSALRVRASAYTSGTATVTIHSDVNDALNGAILAKPTTLLISVTGAAGAAVTATLPSVAGLRHVLDFIRVVRSASVALTAGAAPTVVTTTNLPGSPAFTFGADAAPQGSDKVDELNFGSTGLAATALGTATTLVCPATTGVIWRANVGYRIGL